MAIPGWYPDPEGRPGHVRYWDGARWGAVAQGPTEPPRKPRWAGIALVGLVGAILIGLSAWFLTGPLSAPPETPSPTPIAQQSDGPKPAFSPTPSTAPTATPSHPLPTLNPWDACPVLANAASLDVPDQSGSSHGSAELRYAVPEGWRPTRARVSLVLLEQATSVSYIEESTWFNFILTGYLPKDLGIYTPEDAATAVIQCHITSSSFSGFTGFEVDESYAMNLDGRRGWYQRVTATSTKAPGGGAVYEAVILDTGLPNGFSVFWGGAVLDDPQAIADVSAARESLTVG